MTREKIAALAVCSLLATSAPAFSQAKAKSTPKAKPKTGAPARKPAEQTSAAKAEATSTGDSSQPGLGLATELNEPGRDAVSAEAQQLSRDATVAFAKGDLAAARKGFERVLALVPGNAASTINLGLVAYREKKFDEAERLLTTAVRAQPEAALGWLVLGVITYEQDKLDRALAALSQAVLLAPKDARAHHYLGVTIGKKGWYSGAEDEMRKALELDPNYAEAHFNLAVFYLQRNPPAVELARRHYLKALDLGAAPDAQVQRSLDAPAP
jgi:tetratricopeptide (TPR) repeat protein